MKYRKIGSRVRILFTYIEWLNGGKVFPTLPEEFDANTKVELIIQGVPEDKKGYFENLGCIERMANNTGKGLRIHNM